MSNLSDDRLMSDIAGGDRKALAVLHDRYAARAYRVARAASGDHGLAAKAVEETFLSCWKTSTTYSQRGSVPGWLLVLTRQRAVAAARHASAAGVTIDDADGAGGAMTEAAREVVELAHFGELTVTEIAAHLGIGRDEVKARMRHGLHAPTELLRRDAK